MDNKIKARVGAARVALEQQVGRPTHAIVSKLQAKALIELFGVAQITAEDRLDLASDVMHFQWADQADLDKVMQELGNASHGPEPPLKKARRLNQTFAAVSNYFTDAVWESLTSDAPQGAKLSTILNVVTRLGLRLPTEPTLKWLTSLWLVTSETESALGVMPELTKRTMYIHLKGAFNSLRAKLQDPVEWIDVLPENPFELQAKHPMLWAAAMGGGAPGIAQIDIKKVAELDATYGCRGGRPSIVAPRLSTWQPPPTAIATSAIGGGGGPDQLSQMAMFFMQSMQSLQGNQQKMMELILQGNVRPSAAPRAMSALADMLENREPTITLSPTRRRALLPPRLLGHASSAHAEEIETPSPRSKAPGAIVPVQSASSDGVPKPVVDSPASAGPSGQSIVESFLGMLDARKADKKADKKAAEKAAAEGTVAATVAATAKVSAKAKAVAKAVAVTAVAENAPTAAKAMAKTVAVTAVAAKAPTTAKAVAKKVAAKVAAELAIAPAKAASEATAKIMTKAVVVLALAPAKAMAKDVEKANAPAAKGKALSPATLAAVAKAKAAGLVLGCGKCRWSTIGCGQCRSAEFTGARWNVAV